MPPTVFKIFFKIQTTSWHGFCFIQFYQTKNFVELSNFWRDPICLVSWELFCVWEKTIDKFFEIISVTTRFKFFFFLCHCRWKGVHKGSAWNEVVDEKGTDWKRLHQRSWKAAAQSIKKMKRRIELIIIKILLLHRSTRQQQLNVKTLRIEMAKLSRWLIYCPRILRREIFYMHIVDLFMAAINVRFVT